MSRACKFVAFTIRSPGEISGPLNLGQKKPLIAIMSRQEPVANDEEFTKASDQLREQLAQQKKNRKCSSFSCRILTAVCKSRGR